MKGNNTSGNLTLQEEMESTRKVTHVGKYKEPGTSLVAQWLRIRLPMQGTRIRALVQEDPTFHGAIKPMRHNY